MKQQPIAQIIGDAGYLPIKLSFQRTRSQRVMPSIETVMEFPKGYAIPAMEEANHQLLDLGSEDEELSSEELDRRLEAYMIATGNLSEDDDLIEYGPTLLSRIRESKPVKIVAPILVISGALLAGGLVGCKSFSPNDNFDAGNNTNGNNVGDAGIDARIFDAYIDSSIRDSTLADSATLDSAMSDSSIDDSSIPDASSDSGVIQGHVLMPINMNQFNPQKSNGNPTNIYHDGQGNLYYKLVIPALKQAYSGNIEATIKLRQDNATKYDDSDDSETTLDQLFVTPGQIVTGSIDLTTLGAVFDEKLTLIAEVVAPGYAGPNSRSARKNVRYYNQGQASVASSIILNSSVGAPLDILLYAANSQPNQLVMLIGWNYTGNINNAEIGASQLGDRYGEVTTPNDLISADVVSLPEDIEVSVSYAMIAPSVNYPIKVPIDEQKSSLAYVVQNPCTDDMQATSFELYLPKDVVEQLATQCATGTFNPASLPANNAQQPYQEPMDPACVGQTYNLMSFVTKIISQDFGLTPKDVADNCDVTGVDFKFEHL